MSLTSGEPEAERDAMLFASLVASTRARIGRFPTFDDMTGVLESVVPHPSGLTLLRDLAMRDGEKEVGAGNSLVVVPTIDVPQPSATVGLGDSFTAGVLAMS
jgi:ADP-dependent phosphofructokinase/glucokinase